MFGEKILVLVEYFIVVIFFRILYIVKIWGKKSFSFERDCLILGKILYVLDKFMIVDFNIFYFVKIIYFIIDMY